ncbi:MAG: pyruvate, water dikinase regulatory protein [Thermodesulfobacteriota bacterium]
MAARREKIHVFVVSDGTGLTAERVIRAVLIQFSARVKPIVQLFSHVRSVQHLEDIVAEAREKDAILIYSFVSQPLRKIMAGSSSLSGLETIDLLGPLLERMIKRFQTAPEMRPGMLNHHKAESFRQAACLDFTLDHDDGHGQETLGQADIIILGASRTSKTPTSLYLACNYNLKVANIPIILDLPPPSKLFSLKRPRRFGLTIDPVRLNSIRRRRYAGVNVSGYSELEAIRRELEYADRIYQRLKGVKVIDVTDNTIEETANLIMKG